MLKHFFVLFCVLFLTTSIFAQDNPKVTSLSIKYAIDIALKNHPDIQKSKYAISAAKGRYSRDISLPSPNLSISNEFIPKGQSIGNFDERTVEVSQGFDFPTLYFARGSRATAEINAVSSQSDQTINEIRSSVKMAYYTALAKFKLLKIAEENINIATEFFKKAEIRYNVGEGTNLELLTSKIQLSEAKSFIGTATKEYQTALSELNFAMGSNSNIDYANLKFSDSLYYKPYSLSVTELTDRSLQMNPHLKQAEFDLKFSQINKQIAWMNLIPSFNASYLFQSTATNSNYYGVSLGMSVPLWFMLDQKGQILEANANIQVSSYELQGVKNTITQNINSAFIDYVNDEKQVNLYQSELIPQAEEIFRTADLSYQAGEITYLEFLQAKFTTINARINLIKSLFDYEEAIVNLEKSTGIIIE